MNNQNLRNLTLVGEVAVNSGDLRQVAVWVIASAPLFWDIRAPGPGDRSALRRSPSFADVTENPAVFSISVRS